MLEVQKYLRSGKTFTDLETEFGIKSIFHPVSPIVKLKYSQIDSDKTLPIVRECRGLILTKESFDVLGKSFDRFFNLGEALEINNKFVWDEPFDSFEKADGSLIILFYDPYFSEWKVSTSGSFAEDVICENGPKWNELVFRLLLDGMNNNEELIPYDKNYTYVFELCSPYNKVVREHPISKLVLLSVFNNSTLDEISYQELQEISTNIGIPLVEKYEFKNINDLMQAIDEKETHDPTFEGFVLKDKNGLRIKVKTKTYLALHHLKGNGNVFLNKNLLPFVLKNEGDELLSYFPECKDVFYELKAKVEVLKQNLLKAWRDNHHLTVQKEFATSIKNVTMNSVLFKVRKENGNEQDVIDMFTESHDMILKYV